MNTRILILIFLAVFMYPSMAQEEGAVPDSIEYAALKALYDATNGDNWYDNSGWLSDSGFSDWVGVSVANGDVVKIDLYWNDLEGNIPEEIGDLSSLEELWLDYNYLSGGLPNSITGLSNLYTLVLAKNDLSGNLPEGIGTLENLLELDLNTNNFDGSLPESLYALSDLEVLDLSINSFSGPISDKIGDLVSLTDLQIEDNLFDGFIPNAIGRLTNLEYLYLGYNLFEGSLPGSLSNLQLLKILDIVGSPFIGEIPDLSNSGDFHHISIRSSGISSLNVLSQHQNIDILGIYLDRTQLDFADLEPFFNDDGTVKSRWFIYSPQDSVNTYFSPSDFTYSVEVGGQYNQYQWVKNGQEITGATSRTLAVDASSYEETDTYQCRITNTLVTDLTLWSRSKTIHPGLYYAVADGDWEDPVWSREKDGPIAETYPAEGSEVFIVGKNITLRNDLTTGPVHVVVENAGASLTVDNAEMTIVGTLDLTKETEGYRGEVKVINGGKVIPID